jgi:hypothetical protein
VLWIFLHPERPLQRKSSADSADFPEARGAAQGAIANEA